MGARNSPVRPDQAAAFGRSWAARVLPAGPLTDTDRATVGAAIRRCYRVARLPPPALVLWCTSPNEVDRLDGSAEVRAERLVAGRPRWRRVALVQRVLQPPVRAASGCLLWAWGGLLVALCLVLLVALAPMIILLVVVLAVCVLLRRALLGRRERTSSAMRTLVPSVLLLLWVGAVLAWPERLSIHLDTAGWGTPAVSVLVVVGLALGVVVGTPRGWRAGRARAAATYPRAVEPVDLQISRAVVGRWSGIPHLAEDAAGDVLRPVLDVEVLAGHHERSEGVLPRPVGVAQLVGLALRAQPDPDRWSPPARLRGAWARRALPSFEAAARVGWRPYRRLVVVLEPPREVRYDRARARLHRVDGPAIVWADGTPAYYLLGVRVPRCPAGADWTVAEIAAVGNTEVRRVMIESMGWDTYLRDAGLALVASVPDPANPPYALELYELDWSDDESRLLVMTNASPDRTGDRRRYAEFVPGHLADPVEAVAWQYGVPVEVYRDLQRRT